MSGMNPYQPDLKESSTPRRQGPSGPEEFSEPAGEVGSTERSEPVALATGSRSGVETTSPAAAPHAASRLVRPSAEAASTPVSPPTPDGEEDC